MPAPRSAQNTPTSCPHRKELIHRIRRKGSNQSHTFTHKYVISNSQRLKVRMWEAWPPTVQPSLATFFNETKYFTASVCTDWQQSRGKSSLYRRPVRSVVIIFTLTELMCLDPISRIRAITLVNACTHKTRWTLLHFLRYYKLSRAAVEKRQHLPNQIQKSIM